MRSDTCVPLDDQPPNGIAHIHDRAEPDELILVVLHLQLQNVGSLVTEARLDLYIQLPRLADLAPNEFFLLRAKYWT